MKKVSHGTPWVLVLDLCNVCASLFVEIQRQFKSAFLKVVMPRGELNCVTFGSCYARGLFQFV